MGQAGKDPDFAQEPFPPDRRCHLVAKYLERDDPLVAQVRGAIDNRHTARTNRPFNGVTVRQRPRQSLDIMAGEWSARSGREGEVRVQRYTRS